MLINITSLLTSDESELAVQLIIRIDEFEKQERFAQIKDFKQQLK